MQDKGLDSQYRALEAYLKVNDISTDKVIKFEDKGYSGKNTKRPGLNELFEMVRSNKVESVICYSFSRISRSIKDLIEIVEELEDHKVKFHSLSENVDTSTPMGRCFLNIIASLNQAEREILQERTKNGLRAAVARGVKLGRPKTRKSELIRELRSKGYNYKEIARLASCGVGTVSRELNQKFPLSVG